MSELGALDEQHDQISGEIWLVKLGFPLSHFVL